jgi:Putative peptidoglycan binding domain
MGVRVLKQGSKGKAVSALQKMLNLRGKLPTPVPTDGVFGPETKEGVKLFQKRAGLKADGIVGQQTAAALAKVVGPKAASFAKAFGPPADGTGAENSDKAASGKKPDKPAKDKPAAPKNKAALSGAAWFRANQGKYPNSKSVDKLDGVFGMNVKDFTGALEDAKAKVVVEATKRDAGRAYLMHWSYFIAKGKVKPSAVPKRAGINIEWDHGDDEASKKAAQEMVKLFGIVHEPALTSRHIEGKAIDMTISWSGDLKIKNRKGDEVTIKSSPRNGQNKELQQVGKSYGVIKLVSDPPHWSSDGK